MYPADPKNYMFDAAAAYPQVKVKHPAAKFWGVALFFLFVSWLLCLIAVFVPWSRAFDTPVAGTTTWVALFQTAQTTRVNNRWTANVMANDLDVSGNLGTSVTGADPKCKGYFIAVQVLTIVATSLAFIAMKLVGYVTAKLWFKPRAVAAFSIVLTILTLGVAIAAWACWLVYAESPCPGLTGAPVQGYSWGFIQMCCASGFILIASLFMCLGFMKMKKEYIPPVPRVDYPVMSTSPYMMY